MATGKATEKPRGKAGQFISKEKAENVSVEDLPSLVSKSSKMTGALKTLQKAKEEEELEKPLFSVSINNPISWLLKWFNQLRKKQTTTITFRLGIPLIALPVVITAFAALFFGLGKVTTPKEEVIVEKPVPVTVYPLSRVGTLRVIGSKPDITYYLILAGGEVLEMEPPSNIDLTQYDKKRILASGTYDSKKNILSVENVADLEVLPLKPVVLPTLVPSPTPIEPGV